MTDVIILAGGMGSRLRGIVDDRPKSMALIAGKPFLEYQLSLLRQAGFNKVILSVGYLNTHISSYFGAKWKGMDIDYSVEEEALGTGGAIKKAILKASSDNVLAINGDTLFTIDLADFIQQQAIKKADAVIALRRVSDPGRYGSVITDSAGKILEFRVKGISNNDGLINGGIYLISKGLFENADIPEKFSLEQDLFAKVCNNSYLLGIEYDNYFLDIGIPEDYKRAQHEFPKLKLDASTF